MVTARERLATSCGVATEYWDLGGTLRVVPDSTIEATLAALGVHAGQNADYDAALAQRVRADPLGLDAPVGVNGERLSGGERRRLGLARAYLRDAPWLVLDEPTEGLDAATEAQALAALTRRLSERGQGLILS